MLGDFTGLRIHRTDILVPEIGIPYPPVRRRDGIVSHRLGTGQVVSRDDDAGRAPGRAWHRSERIAPNLAPAAQIDLGDEIRDPSHPFLIEWSSGVCTRPGKDCLRSHRVGVVHIAAHARDDLHKLVRGVVGIDNAMQRVAA